ncbi:MAG TPA: hypothetical protein V6D28_24610 [Leptolyngbyaceae cyanobacterium]
MDIDLSDAIPRINSEMMRLGWTIEEGREYLWRTYKKRSRAQLTTEELVEFLCNLESLSFFTLESTDEAERESQKL